MSLQFDFKTGRVVLNDFDFIEGLEPEEQPQDKIWSFKQDIIQVEYGEEITLDLGWSHDFDLKNGMFKLVVVKKYNWTEPLFCKKTKSIRQVQQYIHEAIDLATNLQREDDHSSS
ncbi:hypothetical protein [Saccharibacillus sacchari]|uniref:hypothetical protein n=1 Tax=Saccharibacillus sacchari TaxID=456493 RepID=UPI000562F1C9|nr:hypothetical protein [Saccharibacillus sacchari]